MPKCCGRYFTLTNLRERAYGRKYLNWEPAVALDEGLGATIAYFREWIA
jgi:nucleoside-diphosphate-sugar epimerase